MSEDTPIVDEPKPSDQPNDGRPWLAIALLEDGSLRVTGWTQDKMVAYGLLESARDAVKNDIETKAKIQRVNGSGGLIQNIRNGFHK